MCLQEDHAGAEEEGVSPLEHYCRELESTASWGGQLELSVLTKVGYRAAQESAVQWARCTGFKKMCCMQMLIALMLLRMFAHRCTDAYTCWHAGTHAC